MRTRAMQAEHVLHLHTRHDREATVLPAVRRQALGPPAQLAEDARRVDGAAFRDDSRKRVADRVPALRRPLIVAAEDGADDFGSAQAVIDVGLQHWPRPDLDKEPRAVA